MSWTIHLGLLWGYSWCISLYFGQWVWGTTVIYSLCIFLCVRTCDAFVTFFCCCLFLFVFVFHSWQLAYPEKPFQSIHFSQHFEFNTLIRSLIYLHPHTHSQVQEMFPGKVFLYSLWIDAQCKSRWRDSDICLSDWSDPMTVPDLPATAGRPGRGHILSLGPPMQICKWG